MPNIEYTKLDNLDHKELLEVMNKGKVRDHLIQHDEFDDKSLNQWISAKIDVDSIEGCIVRGIKVDGRVAGWCGIQYEDEDFELAIVIDDKFWGLGLQIFRKNMEWAEMFGHTHLVLHLLNTRPNYRFLQKMATRVYKTELFGAEYTTYKLPVMAI